MSSQINSVPNSQSYNNTYIAIGVLVFLGLGIGLYMYFNKKSTNKTSFTASDNPWVPVVVNKDGSKTCVKYTDALKNNFPPINFPCQPPDCYGSCPDCGKVVNTDCNNYNPGGLGPVGVIINNGPGGGVNNGPGGGVNNGPGGGVNNGPGGGVNNGPVKSSCFSSNCDFNSRDVSCASYILNSADSLKKNPCDVISQYLNSSHGDTSCDGSYRSMYCKLCSDGSSNYNKICSGGPTGPLNPKCFNDNNCDLNSTDIKCSKYILNSISSQKEVACDNIGQSLDVPHGDTSCDSAYQSVYCNSCPDSITDTKNYAKICGGGQPAQTECDISDMNCYVNAMKAVGFKDYNSCTSACLSGNIQGLPESSICEPACGQVFPGPHTNPIPLPKPDPTTLKRLKPSQGFLNRVKSMFN
jgi:hypothetical protein